VGKLIGIAGPKGVGKTTYASGLAGVNGIVLSFSTPIKELACHIPGVPPEYIYKDKEIHIPGWPNHVTGRFLLQSIGTEFGRKLIYGDIWVDMLRNKIATLLDSHKKIVIDDLRFDNEAMMVHHMGGEVWRLSREGVMSWDTHSSEEGLGDRHVDKDIELPNP
jgi:hypothetical protein